jgi:Dolichyl-phosphate-mannose-protein mannosyltransferase
LNVDEEDGPVLMPLRRSALDRRLPESWCPPLAAALILAATVLHLGFLASGSCRLDLAPDEAHYWDWSRHLDFSYYSKGPLVAWLIRLSCEAFGGWSERVTGSLMFAIRVPAAVCGALLLASLFQLTRQVLGSARMGLALVAVGLTLPLITAGSTLMTIDAPYTCCWGWALVFAHRAVVGGSRWAWDVTGLLIGVGILAKYTMVVFLPSLALFLLLQRDYRRLVFSWGFWRMCLWAALCCLPIAVWNAQNGWVTLLHVARLAGVMPSESSLRAGAGLKWLGPISYVGAQAGLLMGYWFALWLGAMIVANPLRDRDVGRAYLWWMSAPMFALFLGFSLKTGGGEPNWPVTAYLSGAVLAAWWVGEVASSPRPWLRHCTSFCVGITCLLGLAITLFMHRSDLAHPLLERVAGPATGDRPYPARRFDPTCRLRGWRHLASEVDAIRDRLRAEGIEPILVGVNWSVPGELGVYCKGHPPAYSIGLAQGDRHSQYDFWDGPVHHPELFRGKTFIVVGAMQPSTRSVFDRVEPVRTITYVEDGRPLAGWAVTVARGFRGFSPVPQGNH